MKVLTLLTDFGMEDPYVGIMKGVILSGFRDVHLVDITHEITPGDVKKASFFIKHYHRHFPEGTVHLVVIDPTVGTDRRWIISVYNGSFFVGPDNGVLTPVLGDVYEVTGFQPVSSTFHGRDVFAPVCVELLRGTPPEKLGKPVDNPVKLLLPEPKIEKEIVEGEVLIIDRFGNLITNISEEVLSGDSVVIFKGQEVYIKRTYSDMVKGKPLALIDSYGLLEISVNQGSAEAYFNASPGERVIIRRKDG